MSEELLRVLRLSVAHGDVTALTDIDLTVRARSRVAVIGESGSGKSTLVNAILGALPANSTATGSIRIRGQEVLGAPDRELRGLRGIQIASIPQDALGSLDPLRKVSDAVGETLSAHRLVSDRPTRRERIRRALHDAGLPNPDHIAGQYPHRLSGGQRQRATIAAAIVAGAPLVIADEPTSALDVRAQRAVLRHLDTLVHDNGLGLLLVTHDIGVVADHADEVYVLRSGKLVEYGSVTDILNSPNNEYTRRLVDAAARGRRARHTGPDTNHATTAGTAVVEARGLAKRYPGAQRAALRDADLILRSGETVCVVGESGSGKSTLGEIILGTIDPSAGTLLVHRQAADRRAFRRDRTLRRSVQAVFQDPIASLDPRQRVAAAIAEPLRFLGGEATNTARDHATRVHEMLGLVGLSADIAQRRSGEISGGQAQRVALARALVTEPDVIVCDEAVSALDALVRESIIDLLLSLQQRLGLALLFITHDLGVARRLGGETLVLHDGQIVERGPTQTVLDAPQHPYTRSLVEAVPGASLAD
ncbi:MAG: ABC transporter ATP-binding protein [Gordonia sp. (in: high G+C Gram-positive bacteria)]